MRVQLEQLSSLGADDGARSSSKGSSGRRTVRGRQPLQPLPRSSAPGSRSSLFSRIAISVNSVARVARSACRRAVRRFLAPARRELHRPSVGCRRSGADAARESAGAARAFRQLLQAARARVVSRRSSVLVDSSRSLRSPRSCSASDNSLRRTFRARRDAVSSSLRSCVSLIRRSSRRATGARPRASGRQRGCRGPCRDCRCPRCRSARSRRHWSLLWRGSWVLSSTPVTNPPPQPLRPTPGRRCRTREWRLNASIVFRNRAIRQPTIRRRAAAQLTSSVA